MASDWQARYEAVIGLEIHVQLRTRTKMFCGCELSFGDEPNSHTCPICLAHPGTLPVPNRRAIEFALEIALALGCEIAPRSIFHRKNYFYPDSPKAYQISQYDIPLATGGCLGEVRIHRVHLEEDAAKLVHVSESGRIHGSDESLVDFNRGGTPLVEIVTEPDLRDAATAREWLALLRSTIKQIGVSDVNMEEGSLRCDANISLRPLGSEESRGQDRAQEHEQLPLPRAGRGGRARAPGGAARRGRAGRAADAALRPPDRLADHPALEGVRARLPLLPRARSGPAGTDRGDAARPPASRCPSCPPLGAIATCPSSGSTRSPPPSSPSTPTSPPTSSARSRAPTGSIRARSPTGSPASWRRACARRASRSIRPAHG